jgi:ABC-type glycerol-3-phosphate transport system substrate-binding protein
MIMTRLMMIAAASLLALGLTGCGEDNKPAEPAATTTTTTAPAETTTTTTTPPADQKPAEQH